MTAIILAGGKSIRMKGKDKAFLKMGKQTLINQQLKLLKKIFQKIIIVTNSPQKYRNFRQIKIVTDVIPYQGPLGGIYSGLLASSDKYNFVLACDMPFIKISLIKYLLAKKKNYDIILPKIEKRVHPLFGVYSKGCIPAIEETLKYNILKVSSIFPKVRTKFLLKQEIEKFDRDLLSLVNINTPEELKRVKAKKEK